MVTRLSIETVQRIRQRLPSIGIALTFAGVLLATALGPGVRMLMLLPGLCTYATAFGWSLLDEVRRPGPVPRRRMQLGAMLAVALVAIGVCVWASMGASMGAG